MINAQGQFETPTGHQFWVYDLEVFPNYFLATFYNGRHKRQFKANHLPALIAFVCDESKVLGGFNNFDFDDVILRLIISGKAMTCAQIFHYSSKLIEGTDESVNQECFRLRYADTPWAYSIDLFLLLNKKGSLKEWCCKIGSDRIVESSAPFDKPLPAELIPQIEDYCDNDVDTTALGFKKYWHLVTLRHKLSAIYNLGLKPYVLSEAGIAQHTFMTLHRKRTGKAIAEVRKAKDANRDNRQREWKMADIISPRVAFISDEYNAFFNEFKATSIKCLNPMGTAWTLAEQYKKERTINGMHYQFGVGGLHSVDAPGIFQADASTAIIDLDVTSYYPSIIIEEKLAPKQMGADFLETMRDLRDRRVAAKRAGDKGTNEALKIVINSTFGKLNDFYCPFRSVPDALRVTINGQLMLLMLIELIDQVDGVQILSANTDGVTAKVPRYNLPLIKNLMKKWEAKTAHGLEMVEYDRIVRRDVNCYIARYVDGKIKRKGTMNPQPETGKWDNIAAKVAAERYLLDGTDPKITIVDNLKDGRDFLFYQRVKNGGNIAHGTTILGKTARWYIGKNGQQIARVKDGKFACIPNGSSAILAMDITDWDLLGRPDDILFDAYIAEAWDIIYSVVPSLKPPKIKQPRKKKIK